MSVRPMPVRSLVLGAALMAALLVSASLGALAARAGLGRGVRPDPGSGRGRERRGRAHRRRARHRGALHRQCRDDLPQRVALQAARDGRGLRADVHRLARPRPRPGAAVAPLRRRPRHRARSHGVRDGGGRHPGDDPVVRQPHGGRPARAPDGRCGGGTCPAAGDGAHRPRAPLRDDADRHRPLLRTALRRRHRLSRGEHRYVLVAPWTADPPPASSGTARGRPRSRTRQGPWWSGSTTRGSSRRRAATT